MYTTYGGVIVNATCFAKERTRLAHFADGGFHIDTLVTVSKIVDAFGVEQVVVRIDDRGHGFDSESGAW